MAQLFLVLTIVLCVSCASKAQLTPAPPVIPPTLSSSVVVSPDLSSKISGYVEVGSDRYSGLQVRLRDTNTGALAARVNSGANGEFEISGLPIGIYVLELVSANGTILRTSVTRAIQSRD